MAFRTKAGVLLPLILVLSCSPSPEELRAETAPGAAAYGEDLRARLDAQWRAREDSYKPRTRHLLDDGRPKYVNRLFLETSPYLLQHAHNPVDWRPWGDEAFEEARRLDRPVLLSIGYSTCHWCHVMEEESFEDEEIARIINENYIAIKVDREERPDIDAIYMAAVQAMTGRGGWPMTLWLTPHRKPFYAGTYFPARDGDRGAPVGFLTLLRKMSDVYHTRREDVLKNAAALVEEINSRLTPPGRGKLPGVEVLDRAAAFYSSIYDSRNGGSAGAPKFPSSMPVRFLLRYHARGGEERYREMAALTLKKMARGGIYDQIGGGFHRYSTDERWLVPHFEKMLYDNALLVVALLETYQTTGDEEFARVARDVLAWVEREMTSPDGAFYSAADADSLTPEGEREEGYFFTWTPAEIRALLNEEEANIVEAYYGISERGNFEGRSILSRPRSAAEVAAELEVSAERVEAAVEQTRERLYQERAKRPPPLRDDKILTSWNGLMISAHAFAALVLDEPSYAERAGRAADYILGAMRPDGRLYRSSLRGKARHDAYLDDYAFLIASLIDLYEATGELRRLEQAIALDRVLEEHYEDAEEGGYFLTADDHEKLLAREKPNYDGAEPSGNSVQALNLLRLYEFTTEESYRLKAERLLEAFSKVLTDRPAALSEMLPALDFHLDEAKQILIVAPEERDQADELMRVARRTFMPNRILAVVVEGEELARHAKLIPLLDNKRALGGKPTAYVCKQRVCKLPATDAETLERQLRE